MKEWWLESVEYHSFTRRWYRTVSAVDWFRVLLVSMIKKVVYQIEMQWWETEWKGSIRKIIEKEWNLRERKVGRWKGKKGVKEWRKEFEMKVHCISVIGEEMWIRNDKVSIPMIFVRKCEKCRWWLGWVVGCWLEWTSLLLFGQSLITK